MAVVPLTCPRCAGLIQLETTQAGRQIHCPVCQGLFSVPPIELLCPPPVAPPVVGPEVEPPPVDLMPLTCPACGGLFQVATTLAGIRIACPNCNQLVMAPPRNVVEPTPPPPTSSQRSAPQTESPPATEPPSAELTPKQRARRRQTRNLILWAICLVILIAVVWLLR
jgi:DNA-directed RNA polymerase subunit RPC12/RpoP